MNFLANFYQFEKDIQSITSSIFDEVKVTLIGPNGDSSASSQIATLSTKAACLLRKNQVLSFSRLFSKLRV